MDEIFKQKIIKSIIETDLILEQLNYQKYENILLVISLIILIIFVIYSSYKIQINKEK